MLEFHAAVFVKMSSAWGVLEWMLEEADKAGKVASWPIPPENFEQHRKSAATFRRACAAMLLESSADMSTRVEEMFHRETVTQSEYARSQLELKHRFEDELTRRKFYVLRPEVDRYFTLKHPFGDAVAINFSSAAHDIEEASKCYACDRYGATVYHVSRAMESPLRCLAKTLHVKYMPGWSAYLKHIDKRLKKPKSRIPAKRKEFLSNASALLFAVKDAWRNDTMHLEKVYGPDQTARIFESTKAFMMHLAGDLHE